MDCEACGHMMRSLSSQWFWCLECGSIYDGMFPQHTPPKLVERCRRIVASLRNGLAEIRGQGVRSVAFQSRGDETAACLRDLKECIYPAEQRDEGETNG